MPTSRSTRTAARLLDVRSAVRRVIDAVECSSSGVQAPWERVDRIVEIARRSVAGVMPACSSAAA